MQFFWIALAVGSAVPLSASAFDYEISGSLTIQGMDLTGANRSVGPVETTSLADQYSAIGSYAGNEAEARWSADLALGTLRGFAYGANEFSPGLGWRWANGDAHVWMKDTLTLELPAGSYPSGAAIGVSGIVNGSLQSTGIDLFSDATVRWSVQLQQLDGYGYDEIQDDRTASNGETVAVAEPFSLSFQVLSPGSNLTNPLTVTVRVLANLQVIADTYNSLANQHLVEQTDLWNTMQILSVDAPQGATWTSASGVFLPEASVATQAATALLALAALRRRRS
jgi:hypothetical protein